MPDPAKVWGPYGYSPPAFYFQVAFERTPGTIDSSFQEVSGISLELETEEYVEGGENRFYYQLPKGVKHPRLVLKRGIATTASPLARWCKNVIEECSFPIQPRLLKVFLLNEQGDPVRSWSFANAFPVKWEVDSFNSTKNELAIEKIEISYSSAEREL
ncbi:phage tail protein [Pelobacter propionicus]|uniref:Conserved hypothetical phage tail protein n=1 Tax=Pelobacter propionicus (strain DSM 2379 / NBRC 103807 / OttBd1) TaxID=338966 RepID=A1AKY5_PELPD|nr:phage tail protein [Pelobacter propionicus]ABK98005.1 conserved hypothetical phage tail protein [Pelobacter propionicus DSM 2379]